MGIWKQIGFACFMVLAVVGLVIDVGYGFFKVFNTNTTTGTYYLDDQKPVDIETVDESTLTQEQINEFNDRYFFEANLYSNENNNGVILEELNLHYFTNPTMTVASTLSTGMQYVSDYNGRKGLWNTKTYYVNAGQIDNFISPDFEYYETTNGLSWDAVKLQTQLNRNTRFIIKIGGEAYHIQLTGKEPYQIVKQNKNFWEWVSFWNEEYETAYLYYDYSDIFYDIFHGINTNSLGTGTHYATVNLSKYFTVIDHYNTTSKQWEKPSQTDYITTYCAIKFHYDHNGAISKEQSLFKVINDDPRFNLTTIDYDTEYWQERIQYTLTANDLSYRYSSVYNGYFVSLPIKLKTMFADMPKAEVSILLDLNDSWLNSKNIVGFDYKAFENFGLKNITITNGNGDFYILTSALNGTNYGTFTHENLNILGVA
jgi:hypothetical protein